ncbi:MAG: Eco57I restriction-modification methylase domain-containing protein, partial [Candidatus Binatia bacterium]
MATLNIHKTRDLLQQFDFPTLFIEELGWSRPTSRKPETWTCNGVAFERRQIAELSGVVVFEITPQDGNVPDAKTRAAIHKDIAKLHHENLLIFLDPKRTQSLWYWTKREDGKSYPREHLYVRGQPGDLFLSKLGAMVVDLGDFDDTGAVAVVEVAARLKKSLDVEKVTKRFYREFSDQHLAFLELIQGIDDERQRRWYASVLLNRLMFIYFLQRKYFLDNGNARYLQDKLAE